MEMTPDDNLIELMNSPAIKGHVNAKKGEIYTTPQNNILDFTGKKIPLKPKAETPAVLKMRAFMESTINEWLNNEIKEILPEEFHSKIEDRKTLLPILVRFGIEFYVEFVKNPMEEGFTTRPNKYGASIGYITIKGESYSSQVFVWETQNEAKEYGNQSI